LTHCALRTLRKPLTGPGTRCEYRQNGQTKRVPCWLANCSTITAHPGLQKRDNTGSSCAAGVFPGVFPGIFTAAFNAADLRAGARRFSGANRVLRDADEGRADLLLLEALMTALSIARRAGIIFLQS